MSEWLSEPKWENFASVEAYLKAWYWWRAVRREARLTDAERDAKLGALVWKLGYPEGYRP